MNIKTYVSVSMIFLGIVSTGCVTTHQTKGFQTNPSFKTSKGFPHSFAGEKEGNGFQKFFNSLVGKKSPNSLQNMPLNQDGMPLDADATSLHSKGTLSPELLISLGKMGLDKGRYDAAASYFERALQMAPQNAAAKAGLAEAQSKRSNLQNSQQIHEALQQQNGLTRPLGKKGSQSEIQLVSYEMEDENPSEAPEKISLESVEIPKAPEMIMHPEIRFNKPAGQRVANPFFGTSKSVNLKSKAIEEMVEQKKPNKIQIVQPATRKASRSISD